MWIRIRAVIIEDEPLAAQYLAGLLDDTCQVEVVGAAAESEVGLRLCAELRPAGLRQALLSNRACRVSFVNLPQLLSAIGKFTASAA